MEGLELDSYKDLSESLMAHLEQENIEVAEVVVTFNRHITPDEFFDIAATYNITVSTVHAEYTSIDGQGSSEVWTGFIRTTQGFDVAHLNRAAEEQAFIDFTLPHGIVAVYGKIPVAEIGHLNHDSRIFLADTISSSIAIIASQNADVQQALADALVYKKQRIRQQLVLHQGDRQAENTIHSSNLDWKINEMVESYPELMPHVETQVHDLWHLIKP